MPLAAFFRAAFLGLHLALELAHSFAAMLEVPVATERLTP